MNEEYLNTLKNSGYCGGFPNNCLSEDMILKYPRLLASDFAKGKPILSTSQARSFYDLCNSIYLKNSANFDIAKSRLNMLIPRANQRVNRGSLPEDFLVFLERNIEQVKDEGSFKNFIEHFEALCCFLKDSKVNSGNEDKKTYTGGRGFQNQGSQGYNSGNRYSNSGDRKGSYFSSRR